GCLVIVCYKFFRLVFPSLKLDNGPIGFSGPYFTYPMHLGYFSWYLLTAIFFLIHKWIKDISNPKRYIFTVVLFLVFSVTIFLATSKTALIVYAFLFIWFLKIQLKLLQKWYIKLAVIIIPIAILLTVIAQNSTSYPVRRLINIALIFKQTEMNPQEASSIELRYFAWNNAIEVFANNFVIGVGAGY